MQINQLEYIAIFLACFSFKDDFAGFVVRHKGDNDPANTRVNKKRSSDPSLCPVSVSLNLLQRNNGFEVNSDHVPGVENVGADDCSRRWLHQVTTKFGNVLTVQRPSVREALLYIQTHLPKYHGCFMLLFGICF